MHVLIPGGSGLVGRSLISYLALKNYKISVLTHKKTVKKNLNFPDSIEVLKIGDPLPRVDAIINLAGARISTYPLTKSRLKTILSSRLDMIEYLYENYKDRDISKIHFLQASATGLYKSGNNAPYLCDENGDIDNNDYSFMCKSIERKASLHFSNVTFLRLGVVLGNGGGLVSLLKFIPRIKILGQTNYVPYILNQDLAYALELILTRKVFGTVNLCSDKYLKVNEVLSLAQKNHPKFTLKIPGLFLKLDKRGQLLLVNQKIKPQKLLIYGFNFSQTPIL